MGNLKKQKTGKNQKNLLKKASKSRKHAIKILKKFDKREKTG